MTPTEINDLKRQHNQLLADGQRAYAHMLKIHARCVDLQKTIEAEEGDDYDPIPLIFGGGFWVDESL